MKVGDLVTLSANGSKSDMNSMVLGLHGLLIKHCDVARLYSVKWFNCDGEPYTDQSHYRYEIKKFKKSKKFE